MPFQFNNTYARLPDAFYAGVNPASVSQPELIRCNRNLAETLGIDPEWLESPAGLEVLSGNKLPEGSEPLAMAYAGHQFGNFVPQLGDGRAVLLGEVVGRDGIRRDIHLKGSGPTPFSRRGDGLSALGPVLREYIISEAMAALGVPTTRALAAVASGDRVYRENIVPGGVFTRVAQSHIRVGTFQWFAAREDWVNLRLLMNYVIDRLYPEAKDAENPALTLLHLVCDRQAKLIAQWMSFGFIHGVMNTDNMNVSGETIDYGPCAFMDTYHLGKKFSSIDHGGRYAYGNQASIAQWNLARFAETLISVLDENRDTAIESANQALNEFSDTYHKVLRERFIGKIGLESDSEADWQLVQTLLETMTEARADFTLVFRILPSVLAPGHDHKIINLFETDKAIEAWLLKWRERLSDVDHKRAVTLMQAKNPIFIPRNHRVEQAIAAGNQGDFKAFHQLNEVLRNPFVEQPQNSEYENPPQPAEVVQATYCGT